MAAPALPPRFVVLPRAEALAELRRQGTENRRTPTPHNRRPVGVGMFRLGERRRRRRSRRRLRAMVSMLNTASEKRGPLQ